MAEITFTQRKIPETMDKIQRILMVEGMVQHIKTLFDEASRWKKEYVGHATDKQIRCVSLKTPYNTIFDEASSRADYYCDDARRRLDAPSPNGMTPLMEAAYVLPHVHGVQTLLTLGANPNLQNNNGQTALMLALEAGHLSSAEAISFASGSALLLTDNQGKKAVDYLSEEMKNTACGKKVVERTIAQEHAIREQALQLHVN